MDLTCVLCNTRLLTCRCLRGIFHMLWTWLVWFMLATMAVRKLAHAYVHIPQGDMIRGNSWSSSCTPIVWSQVTQRKLRGLLRSTLVIERLLFSVKSWTFGTSITWSGLSRLNGFLCIEVGKLYHHSTISDYLSKLEEDTRRLHIHVAKAKDESKIVHDRIKHLQQLAEH